MSQKSIYLDYASATPMDPGVLAAMQPYFTEQFYNPSAIYLPAIKVKKDLAAARTKIAAWLGARPSEIYFTAGATEANNLAIQGLMNQWPDGQVLVSAVEHESVLVPAQLYNHQQIPVSPQGIVEIDALKNLINPKTVLISVMMVSNELGSVQPIKQIASMVREMRAQRSETKNSRPLYLHTDAAQAGNLFDLHTHRLGVDMMSINGGKIYGPKQSGALFAKSNVQLTPLIVGGGQEHNLRSGTENVPGAIGLSKALDLAQKMHAKEFKRQAELRQKFTSDLAASFPKAMLNGAKKRQSPHIMSVTFPGVDNERLMMQLDEAGIQVAVGSACSAARGEPSHVLAAIGLGEQDARSTIRVSLGRVTTKAQLRQLLEALVKLIAKS